MLSFPQDLKYVQFNLEHANMHGIYVHRPEALVVLNGSAMKEDRWSRFEPRGRSEIDVKYMKM